MEDPFSIKDSTLNFLFKLKAITWHTFHSVFHRSSNCWNYSHGFVFIFQDQLRTWQKDRLVIILCSWMWAWKYFIKEELHPKPIIVRCLKIISTALLSYKHPKTNCLRNSPLPLKSYKHARALLELFIKQYFARSDQKLMKHLVY